MKAQLEKQLKPKKTKKKKKTGKKAEITIEIDEEDKVDINELQEPTSPKAIKLDAEKAVHLNCVRAEPRATIIGTDSAHTVQKAMYFNPYKQEYFDVENLALRYYSLHENLSGMHCENSFGKTLFGILFWEDAIFYSKIPFVF